MTNLIPDFVVRQINESIAVKEAMLNDAGLIDVVESIAALPDPDSERSTRNRRTVELVKASS